MKRALLVVVLLWSCSPELPPFLVVDDASFVDAGDAGELDAGDASFVDAGDVDGGTDAGICFPETEAQTCERLALCGVVDAPDNCGVVVRLDCASCDAGGPLDVDAGCVPEGGGHTCARLDLCGTVTATDNCGTSATIFCRSCGDGGPELDAGQDAGSAAVDAGPPDDSPLFFQCGTDADCTVSVHPFGYCDRFRHVCVVIGQGPTCDTCGMPSPNSSFRHEGAIQCVPGDTFLGGGIRCDAGCPTTEDSQARQLCNEGFGVLSCAVTCSDARFKFVSAGYCAVGVLCESRVLRPDAGQ